ncbi:HNH endonuclease signature motif containing protein [Escherichia coli]|uniref:HNH endonuclease n=3 Tax=Escherichia coli TaxID=562 RepID=A0A8T6BI84_ECOLX|nr:HNH endonuclease signature motif containing protein [Escherichia coli]AYU97219.1 HNH endonuclease [Enterobacter cloacae]EEV2454311.1 HNH endonuclease [Escherichia coli]EEW2424718.1 HNH endonuclease [Escherichia coli]EFB8854141.1 HNH endonuclease [Escherichia coli]EFC5878196.1 HNH endonuclease [Escherichia coli]
MVKPYEDPALLAELFTYDPATGRVFHARDKRSGHGCIKAHAGDYADTVRRTDGYRQVCVTVGGRSYMTKAHRVAWILEHDAIPDGLQVDHVSGVRDDNRLCNLRLVTNRENQHNRRAVKGYSWYSQYGKWLARISVGGHDIHLGYHDTELDARAAYLRAKRVYHPTAPVNLLQAA